MRRLAPLALLSLAVLLAACEYLPPWLGGFSTPPYELFGRSDMRPGVTFAELDQSSRREGPQRFFCSPLWAGAQSCKVDVKPGEMRAIVNSDGIVMRLMIVAPDSFFYWNYTPFNEPKYRMYVKALRATWDSVRPHRFGPLDRGAEFRWVEPDGRWTAQMWYSPWTKYKHASPLLHDEYRDSLARVPDSIAVTDEPEYNRFVALRPPPDTQPTPARKVDPNARPVELFPEPTPSAVVPPEPVDSLALHWASRALRDKLLQVAELQQRYHAIQATYASKLDQLRLTPDINIELELVGTKSGWSATAKHRTLPMKSCVYYVGTGILTPDTYADRRRGIERQVVCDKF